MKRSFLCAQREADGHMKDPHKRMFGIFEDSSDKGQGPETPHREKPQREPLSALVHPDVMVDKPKLTEEGEKRSTIA